MHNADDPPTSRLVGLRIPAARLISLNQKLHLICTVSCLRIIGFRPQGRVVSRHFASRAFIY